MSGEISINDLVLKFGNGLLKRVKSGELFESYLEIVTSELEDLVYQSYLSEEDVDTIWGELERIIKEYEDKYEKKYSNALYEQANSATVNLVKLVNNYSKKSKKNKSANNNLMLTRKNPGK